MVSVEKWFRRQIIDGVTSRLMSCTDECDILPDLINQKYGERTIGTSMGRLSGNCEVVYDFASTEFPDEGEWIQTTGTDGRLHRHYAGETALSNVLPYVFQRGETVYHQRPVYERRGVWDGYQYNAEIDYMEDDTDREPEYEGSQWGEYRENIARAISAVVSTLVLRHAETQPPSNTYDIGEWFLAELRKPLPPRKVVSVGEWLRGFNGVASWRGYPDRNAVGNFLPWTLTRETAPSSVDNPLPPNHRECLAGLPIAGYHSGRDGGGGYDNARYDAINGAFYGLRRELDYAGRYGSPAFNDAVNVHYRYQDTISDDRAALTFLRSHGVTV